MASERIPDTSRVADIVGSLRKPVEYVRNVLDHMHNCGLDRETVRVRIGTMGAGKMPYYKLEEPKTISGKDIHTGEAVSTDYLDTDKIYRGSNHKEVTHFTKRDLRDMNWSSETMGYEEIQVLLGALRKAAKSKPV